ncbi:MAG: adenosylcobinamide-GDP ribazoletransferase [Clostridia bacterium]|nr:adenosylcobinamide-GDP ribazoletransferase [Clostridia bacterium]
MLTRLLMALQNITRIYIYPVKFDEVKFGQASAFFPLVGLIIGAALYSIYHVSAKVFPMEVVAALVVVGQIFITGGMHLDGWMDSMDGLFSGRSRERKLEIMRDSRVGANGVIGLVALLLLKYTLLLHLPVDPLTALLLMGVVSRWAMVYTFRFFPYARSEGMGRAYKAYTGWREFLVATATVVVAVYLVAQVQGLILLGLICLLTHFIARQVTHTIGGMTGDTYGATSEGMEVATLFLLYIIGAGEWL